MTKTQLANKLNDYANGLALLPIKTVNKILGNSSYDLAYLAAGTIASVMVTCTITVPMMWVAEKIRKL